jgi:hypothetical protein
MYQDQYKEINKPQNQSYEDLIWGKTYDSGLSHIWHVLPGSFESQCGLKVKQLEIRQFGDWFQNAPTHHPCRYCKKLDRRWDNR